MNRTENGSTVHGKEKNCGLDLNETGSFGCFNL